MNFRFLRLLPFFSLSVVAYDVRALLLLEQSGSDIVFQVSGNIDLNLVEEKVKDATENIYRVLTVAGASEPANPSH